MKIKLLSLMVVVSAILLSAFTVVNNKKVAKSVQTNYVWHKYNNAGTAELSPAVTFIGTADGGRSSFGCLDPGSVTCARAYDDEGNPLGIFISKPAP